MADSSTLTPLKRREKVVNIEPLPGVPAGTPGRVVTQVGLTWERYFVHFDNGVERSSIGRDALARAGENELAASLTQRAPVGTSPWVIAAVVLAALVPPVGAILGHRILADVGSGERPERDRSGAMAAIAVGWTLTAVGFFVAVYLLAT